MLTLLISGIIITVLGITLIKSDLMYYIGLGLLTGAITISIMETLMKRK